MAIMPYNAFKNPGSAFWVPLASCLIHAAFIGGICYPDSWLRDRVVLPNPEKSSKSPPKSSKTTKITPPNPAKPPKSPLQIQKNHPNHPPNPPKPPKCAEKLSRNQLSR